MAEAPTEVLNLKVHSAPKRRTIVIDDQVFDILDMRELSLAGKAVAIRVSHNLVAFGEGKLDGPGLDALQKDLNAVVGMVVPGINAIIGGLTDDDKCAIVMAFCAPRKTPALEGSEQAAQPAGVF